MKTTLLFFLLAGLVAPAALGQIAPPQDEAPFVPKSGGKAFVMSLAVPGLGQRYVQGGSWRGAATVYALADAALWTSLGTALWRRDQTIENYRTLAAAQAGAQLAGKDRRFFLNLATFRSSDEFLDVQLRNRNWDEVDYVSDPAFQWEWTSDAAFQEYRDLRDEADAWGRRRTLFISTLVANRLVAGLTALRAAGRHNRRAPDLALAFTLPPEHAHVPTVHLSLRLP